MPQAIPVIISAFQAAASYAAAATFAVTGSAGFASFVANTVLGVAGVTTAGLPLASAAASFIQASLLQQLIKAISPKPKNLNGGSQVRFGPNPQAPRPFIFGRTGTAGTPVVATTHGSGKNNNKWLTYIVALSAFGPVQSIEALALNGVNASITNGMVTGGQYANRVWSTYRNGEWTQVWTPTFGPSTIPEWTPNHRGAGIAHACLTYEYDTNVFTGGAPAPVWTVQGSTSIYNASTLSVGYSANPADVYYTLLRGIQSPNGNRIGVGLDAAYIDQARIAAWRAVCVANNWTCGGVWQITADSLGDALRAILQAGGAEFAINDGKASVDFFTSAASAYTIRENDLSGDPIERPTTDRKARVSRIVPRFRSEAEGWELVPAAAVQDSTLDTEDRGRRRTDTMDFPYVSSAQQARQLAAYNLRVRRSPIVELPVKPHGIGIPCGARVTLDLPEYGISSSTGVVIKNEATATEGGVLAVRLDPADLHTWALGQDGSTVSPGSMPRDPASTVQNVDPADWSAVAASTTASGTTLPIIRVTGTFPNPTLARLDVQIKPNASTEWVDTNSLVAGTPALEIRSLTPNTIYNIRARYVTIGGVASPAWVNFANVTTGAHVAGEAAAGPGGAPILNSQVVGFANQAVDTEFQYVLRTWSNNFASGGAWTFGTNTTNGARWLRRSSSNAPAGSQVNLGQDAGMGIPVVAGQRIEASVTFNWLNFSIGRLFVTWYDANRGYITDTFIGQTTVNGGSVGGFVTVPANARFAALTTASDTVTANIASWVEIGRPFLRIASAEQTALSPYVPGPVERNADQTGSNTAAGIAGQGPWATETTPVGVVTLGNPNLVKDSSFLAGVGNSFSSNWSSTGGWYRQDVLGLGSFAQIVANGTQVITTADFETVSAGQVFSLQAEFRCGGLAASAVCLVDIIWTNNSGLAGIIGYSTPVGLNGAEYAAALATAKPGGWVRRTSSTSGLVAPTGATRAYVRAYVVGTNTDSGVRNIKLEAGQVCTLWSDDRLKPRESGADVTGGNTAAAIVAQGDLATTNRVQLPFGTNQVVNSDFSRGTYGWASGASAGQWGVNLSPDWSGQRNVFFFGVPGTLAENAQVDTSPATLWLGLGVSAANTLAMPVAEGDRIVARALMARHRCRSQLWILAFNSAGALVAAVPAEGGRVNGAGLGDPANFDEVTVATIAPAGARYAIPMVRMIGNPGGSLNPYVFFTEPLLARVPANQTAIPPYVPGRTDPVADRTGDNTAGAIVGQGTEATVNRFRQATAPTSPNEGDWWFDTSTSPVTVRRRVGGIWLFHSQEGADITAISQRTIVPQFPVIEIRQGEAGHTGSRTVTHSVVRGTTTITGGTYSLPTFNLGSGSATINSSTGTVTLSGIVQSGSYTIRYVHTDGITTELNVNVTYVSVPAAVVGGSKGNFATSSNGISSSTFADIVAVSVGSTPAGVIDYAKSRFVPLTVGNPGGGSSFYRLQLTVNGTEVYQSATFQGVDSSGILTPDWSEEVYAAFAYIGAFAGGLSTHALRARRTSGSSWIDSSDALLFATVSVAT